MDYPSLALLPIQSKFSITMKHFRFSSESNVSDECCITWMVSSVRSLHILCGNRVRERRSMWGGIRGIFQMSLHSSLYGSPLSMWVLHSFVSRVHIQNKPHASSLSMGNSPHLMGFHHSRRVFIVEQSNGLFDWNTVEVALVLLLLFLVIFVLLLICCSSNAGFYVSIPNKRPGR